MAEHVTIFETGPRDGLQNEAGAIPAAHKARLVDLLSACGLKKIEVTSFVSPRWVPQLADAAEVMAAIRRKPETRYTALIPNLKGFAAALAAGADEVAVFASASEGFSRQNINCSISESLARFEPVLAAARERGTPVRGYVSCITDCPFDGEIAPAQVARVAERLLTAGCYEVSLGDTLGAATPPGVERLLGELLARVPAARLAGHFHDTKGMALANIQVCLAKGLRVFDAAIGGLGGCPYAPGARGNVATETVVELLDGLGYTTGVDPQGLQTAARFARQIRGKP